MNKKNIHQHDENEGEDLITLIDDEGNETLFEILMTIDGQEQFGKNYVLLYPAGLSEKEETDLFAYSFTEDPKGTQGILQAIPENSDAEWDMIEEIVNTFMAEE